MLVSFPLTGAALNPARWFGTVFWENWATAGTSGRSPFADVLVYLAGPIVGALLGGSFCFLFYLSTRQQSSEHATPGKTKK